jgi:PAS domain S-box-containing protein
MPRNAPLTLYASTESFMVRRSEQSAANASRTLQLNEARWRAVLDTARDPIVSINGRGQITLFNRAAELTFGYRADEVIGQNVKVLMAPPYVDEHDQYLRNYRQTGVPKAIGRVREVEARRKSGETFPIELSVSEARVGSQVLYSAIIRDVSERRRADASVIARAEQQAAVAQLGRLALAQITVQAVMDEAATLVARTLEVEFCEVLELLPGTQALRLRAGVGWKEGLVGHATLGAETSSHGGYTLLTRQPVVVEDLCTEQRFIAPLLQDHSVVSGVSVIIHEQHQAFGVLGAHTARRRVFAADDINFLQSIANVIAEAIARQRGEAQLREAQKLAQQRERLADIGAITARIVHDLGNPLAGLSMQAQLLLRRVERGGDDKLRAPAERILSTVGRLDVLVKEFLAFSRERRLNLKLVALPQLLKEIIDLWHPVAATREIDLSLDTGAVEKIRADEVQLRRVLDNLVKNAIEAIDRGPGSVRIEARIPTTERIRISVEDTGPGIPPTIEVFRLFETTKAEGTGLGLAVARQIVMAHGGGITFAPRTPHGTIFHVELPRSGPGSQADDRTD